MTAPFDPAADGWEMIEHSAFVALVGPVWRRRREGRWVYGMLTEAKHANRNGVAHGGVVTTLLDVALGRTSSEAQGDRKQATLSLDVQFLKPLRLGEFAEIEGTVVRATRSILFLRGDLHVAGDVRATAQGTWKILGS